MISKVPILLYHDLESVDYPSEKSDTAARSTVVNVNNFEEQIKYLSENGYETISIKEFFSYAGKQNSIPPGKIIITFDDGHYSNYHLVLPILLELGFRATFFIVADRINSQHYLNYDQIKEMSDMGMEIGSHGLTHKYFPLMNIKEVEHELSESKKILESIIDKTVDYLAFPGGHYNRHVLNMLQASGYKGACSCLQGLNSLINDPYLLKRIEIRRNVAIEDFAHILDPRTIAFYQLVDRTKGLLRRSLGLQTYSWLRSRFYKFYKFKR